MRSSQAGDLFELSGKTDARGLTIFRGLPLTFDVSPGVSKGALTRLTPHVSGSKYIFIHQLTSVSCGCDFLFFKHLVSV